MHISAKYNVTFAAKGVPEQGFRFVTIVLESKGQYCPPWQKGREKLSPCSSTPGCIRKNIYYRYGDLMVESVRLAVGGPLLDPSRVKSKDLKN